MTCHVPISRPHARMCRPHAQSDSAPWTREPRTYEGCMLCSLTLSMYACVSQACIPAIHVLYVCVSVSVCLCVFVATAWIMCLPWSGC